MIFWVDIIEEIVQDVQTSSDKPVGLDSGAPYYMHGHPAEITTQLEEKEKNGTFKFQTFPMIALIQDFTESNGQDMMIKSSATLRILIVQATEPNYTSEERYTNTFKTVLQPLYELFIQKLVTSNYFSNVSPGLIPHEKTDHPYWGRNSGGNSQANIFNNILDAIEIQNLQLDLRLTQIKC